MHEEVREKLEDLVEDPDKERCLASVRAHLEQCPRCRQELRDMQWHSSLLRTLRSPVEIVPQPGFYTRVMAAVEAQRNASVWAPFLEPGFGLRFVLASLAAALFLGALLFHEERQPIFGWSNPISLIATQAQSDQIVGSNPARDRDALLLSLASYKE